MALSDCEKCWETPCVCGYEGYFVVYKKDLPEDIKSSDDIVNTIKLFGQGDLEIKLFNIIKDLYQEIKDMHPVDGLSTPRDIELVTKINQKTAVMDKLQEALRVFNPEFEIRDNK